LFLQDIAMAIMDGKPAMYDTLQTLESPPCARSSRWARPSRALVVHKPTRMNPAYPLKEWDVIHKKSATLGG